ncbi:hypothetical protein U1Q18_011829 [Sarracenia purpurea var. burkii]
MEESLTANLSLKATQKGEQNMKQPKPNFSTYTSSCFRKPKHQATLRGQASKNTPPRKKFANEDHTCCIQPQHTSVAKPKPATHIRFKTAMHTKQLRRATTEGTSNQKQKNQLYFKYVEGQTVTLC